MQKDALVLSSNSSTVITLHVQCMQDMRSNSSAHIAAKFSENWGADERRFIADDVVPHHLLA